MKLFDRLKRLFKLTYVPKPYDYFQFNWDGTGQWWSDPIICIWYNGGFSYIGEEDWSFFPITFNYNLYTKYRPANIYEFTPGYVKSIYNCVYGKNAHNFDANKLFNKYRPQ